MEFKRHFSKDDLGILFDDSFSLPDDFIFGVANSAYQTEGGLNGPGEPLNNWVDGERSGRYETTGEGIRFWTDYPEDIKLAKKIGLNGFRMGIEWARVQPSTSHKIDAIPSFDQGALEKYSDTIAEMMKAGLEPMITLHHFTHPRWLGIDFWLVNENIHFFAEFTEEVAEKVNTFLVEKHGLRPIKLWITINEPNALSMGQYMTTFFPGRKWGIRKTGLAWGNMIDAHCRAYDAIHRVYKEKGWDKPLVSYNTAFIAIYLLDKVMTDMLLARSNGIERKDLPEFLKEGKKAWDEEVARCPVVRKAPWINCQIERALTRATDLVFRLEDFKNGIDAIYSSPNPDKLDYLAVDFYDPFFRHMVKLPTLQDIREGRFNLNYENWEWVLNPRALYHFLKAECVNAEGVPIMIVENGMAYKVYKGRVEARRDGATRDVFLQTHLYEAMRAMKDGVPLKGYFHWTLVDNYEWGSYDPRYGLYTVDRTVSPVERRGVDAWGVDAGKAYGELVGALKSGDRQKMVDSFSKDGW